MIVIKSFTELAEQRKKISGGLAFVPTMGALHAGHLHLVQQAKKYAANVLVSIFVNPTQFGAGEDFAKYPRTPEDDIKKLKGLADYIYLPSVADIYHDGEQITLRASAAAEGLEGSFRPQHFDGVVTVVSKLFEQVQPDFALFGEKDFQQLQVIREMNFSPAIIGVPTIREADGLAMSSRNIYLSPEERKIAPLLYKALSDLRMEYSEDALNANRQTLSAHFKIDYLEHRWNRILAAAWLGKTRLIDNVPLDN